MNGSYSRDEQESASEREKALWRCPQREAMEPTPLHSVPTNSIESLSLLPLTLPSSASPASSARNSLGGWGRKPLAEHAEHAEREQRTAPAPFKTHQPAASPCPFSPSPAFLREPREPREKLPGRVGEKTSRRARGARGERTTNSSSSVQDPPIRSELVSFLPLPRLSPRAPRAPREISWVGGGEVLAENLGRPRSRAPTCSQPVPGSPRESGRVGERISRGARGTRGEDKEQTRLRSGSTDPQ